MEQNMKQEKPWNWETLHKGYTKYKHFSYSKQHQPKILYKTQVIAIPQHSNLLRVSSQDLQFHNSTRRFPHPLHCLYVFICVSLCTLFIQTILKLYIKVPQQHPISNVFYSYMFYLMTLSLANIIEQGWPARWASWTTL
jgi:hypothetical protein